MDIYKSMQTIALMYSNSNQGIQQMEKEQDLRAEKLGWIGTVRMGYAMAIKLLEAGCDTSAYNRTRAKAEPLETLGARIVDTPAELSDRDIIFTMVSGSDDLFSVICGDHGVLAGSATPKLLIDCSSVSEEGSQRVRDALKERGCNMLSAPVSGNAKVIKAGRLTVVASGPKSARGGPKTTRTNQALSVNRHRKLTDHPPKIMSCAERLICTNPAVAE